MGTWSSLLIRASLCTVSKISQSASYHFHNKIVQQLKGEVKHRQRKKIFLNLDHIFKPRKCKHPSWFVIALLSSSFLCCNSMNILFMSCMANYPIEEIEFIYHSLFLPENLRLLIALLPFWWQLHFQSLSKMLVGNCVSCLPLGASTSSIKH